MKERRIYYRRKGKSIVIEGKQDGRSVLIWTLPNPEKLIYMIGIKASDSPMEKIEKIMEKIKRLDTKERKAKEKDQEVPLMNIRRTFELDAKKELTEEEKKDIWELSK